MNIEQIAITVDAEMYEEGRFPPQTAYPEEFLRRCLSKLAEQAGEPVAYAWDSESAGLTYENHYSDTTPLFTEAQLIAAQQRTAEACAKVCEAERSEDGDGQHPAWYAGFDACADAIRNGEWREYL